MKLALNLSPILLLLCGCASQQQVEFVHQEPQKHAVIRYITPIGGDPQIDYKAAVNDEATDFCKGAYEIKSEQKALSDASSPSGTEPASVVVLRSSENKLATYDYVEFVCR